MTSKNEQVLAFVLAGVLFLVGVICYAAFPQEAPDEPVRLMFKTTAGKVLFDHKTHTVDAGYDIPCDDCHHDGDEPIACGECHEADSDLKRADAIHEQCKGCHEESGAGPVACSACHVM